MGVQWVRVKCPYCGAEGPIMYLPYNPREQQPVQELHGLCKRCLEELNGDKIVIAVYFSVFSKPNINQRAREYISSFGKVVSQPAWPSWWFVNTTASDALELIGRSPVGDLDRDMEIIKEAITTSLKRLAGGRLHTLSVKVARQYGGPYSGW